MSCPERQRAIDAEAATARQRKLTKLAVTAAAIAAVLSVIGIWATWTAILARKHADDSAEEAMAQRMAAKSTWPKLSLPWAEFALKGMRSTKDSCGGQRAFPPAACPGCAIRFATMSEFAPG